MRASVRSRLPASVFVVAALAAGCTREAAGPASGAAAAAAPPEPPAITAEEMARPSPSAALVAVFAAVCGEPARSAVARAARRRDFVPVPPASLRKEAAGAVFPEDAEAWLGTGEAAGALLFWDATASSCEMRAQGVDPVVVEAEFAKLPQALEEAGSSVMRSAAAARASRRATDAADAARQPRRVEPAGACARAAACRRGGSGRGRAFGAGRGGRAVGPPREGAIRRRVAAARACLPALPAAPGWRPGCVP